MLDQTYAKYLSRLLLTFSDLCDTDEEIALCLAFMRITPPVNELQWTASAVRRQMPVAYSTVSSASQYAPYQPSPSADAYCLAVANIIRARKDAKL